MFSYIASVLTKHSNGSQIRHQKNVNQHETPVIQGEETVSDEKSYTYFRDASHILETEQCQYCLSQIKEIAGLADEQFEKYYLPAIQKFAVLCQDLGASERYHHAYPFGLIEHSLEVAMYAMRKAQGMVYFPDGNIETRQWLERVFMYTTFLAGLLHDGGKIFTNFSWSIQNQSGAWISWNPLIHAVPTGSERVKYRTSPLQNKNHVNVFNKTSHELFASNLLQDVVPRAGLEWILDYSDRHCAELWIHFVHTLASDYQAGDQIGECVSAADKTSTADAVKRYHLQNKSQSYVDLDDPNLPLHESYKEIFASMFRDPASFNLVINKVAMGKFSHIERFGDLLFVSAKGVLPIAHRRLKELNIRLPNDQAAYTLLADNGVTLKAPSEDTLWWCEFYSDNNNNKSKEVSYLVFDINQFTDIDIPDLRQYEVQLRVSDKSLGQADELNPSDHPELYSKLYDGAPSVAANPTASEYATQPEAPKATGSENDQGAAAVQVPDELDNNARISEVSQSSEPTGMALGEASEKPTTQSGHANQIIETASQDVADKPKSRTPLRPPTQAAQQPTNESSSASTNKKERKPRSSTSGKKNNQSEAAQDDQTPSNGKKSGNTSSTKPKNSSSNKSKTGGKPNKGSLVETGLSKALGITVSGKSPTLHSKPQNSVPAEPVCNIPKDDSPADTNSPFASSVQIKDGPNRSLDATVVEGLMLRPVVMFDAQFRTYTGEDGLSNSEKLIGQWLPYLSDLAENGLITFNQPGAVVYHIQNGLFFVKEAIEAIFTPELSMQLCSILQSSHLTLTNNNQPELTLLLSDGVTEVCGYVVGSRLMKSQNRPIPLQKTCKLKK